MKTVTDIPELIRWTPWQLRGAIQSGVIQAGDAFVQSGNAGWSGRVIRRLNRPMLYDMYHDERVPVDERPDDIVLEFCRDFYHAGTVYDDAVAAHMTSPHACFKEWEKFVGNNLMFLRPASVPQDMCALIAQAAGEDADAELDYPQTELLMYYFMYARKVRIFGPWFAVKFAEMWDTPRQVCSGRYWYNAQRVYGCRRLESFHLPLPWKAESERPEAIFPARMPVVPQFARRPIMYIKLIP